MLLTGSCQPGSAVKRHSSILHWSFSSVTAGYHLQRGLIYFSLFADTVRWQLIWVLLGACEGGGDCLLRSSWSEGEHWGLGVRRRLWDTNHSGVPDLLAFGQWRLVTLRAPSNILRASPLTAGGAWGEVVAPACWRWASDWEQSQQQLELALPRFPLLAANTLRWWKWLWTQALCQRQPQITIYHTGSTASSLLLSCISGFDDCCFSPVYKGRIRQMLQITR